MPFVVTPSNSGGGFGGFFDDVLDFGKQALGNFFSPDRRAQLQPGINAPVQAGFPIVPFVGRAAKTILPALGIGAVGGELADAFQRLISSGGAGTLDEGAAFTDPVPGSCRPKAHVKLNPCTGKGIWFVPRGRPLVFSGDLSACKRVNRVAKTLTKAMPARRHSHSRARKR